jgi:hypothetical protein
MAKRRAICGKTDCDLWQNASHFAIKRNDCLIVPEFFSYVFVGEFLVCF